MTLNEFVAAYNGRAVDFDGAYGCQCVDLAQFYNRDVVGNPSRFTGNAKDIINQPGSKYREILNSPTNYPKPGSVIVFGSSWGGGYGHVAIVLTADPYKFTAINQNNPYGTASHVTSFPNYSGVVGWLEPVADVNPGTAGGGTVARRITVTVPTLYVRTQPNTSAPAGQANRYYFPDGNLHYGNVADIVGWQHAQNVNGNDVWLKTAHGTWIWSGGTNW